MFLASFLWRWLRRAHNIVTSDELHRKGIQYIISLLWVRYFVVLHTVCVLVFGCYKTGKCQRWDDDMAPSRRSFIKTSMLSGNWQLNFWTAEIISINKKKATWKLRGEREDEFHLNKTQRVPFLIMNWKLNSNIPTRGSWVELYREHLSYKTMQQLNT